MLLFFLIILHKAREKWNISFPAIMQGATLSGSCMAQKPVYGCGDKLPSTEDARKWYVND